MTEAETPVPDESPKPKGTSRWRIIGARVLTVLAILLALVGMVAFYVEHTALDEDGFETISRNMIENDEIRTQVAAKSVDTLFENVDVEAAIAERLPPAQQGLAPVLAGLARSGADRAADAALERPRVQTVWVEVTTTDPAPAGAPAGRRHDVHPDRGWRGRARPPPARDRARRPGRGDRKGRREAPGVLGKDRDHRGEPARDGADGHEDPARGRRLDVARRACRRSPRGLACPRAAEARASRDSARSARRRASDVGGAPLRRRLPRRRAREGRRRQAGGTRRLETSSPRSWPTALGSGSSSVSSHSSASGSSGRPDARQMRAASRNPSSRIASRPTRLPLALCSCLRSLHRPSPEAGCRRSCWSSSSSPASKWSGVSSCERSRPPGVATRLTVRRRLTGAIDSGEVR